MENNPTSSLEANTITNLLRGNALLLTGQFQHNPINLTPLSTTIIEWDNGIGGKITFQIDGGAPALELFVSPDNITPVALGTWKYFGPFRHFLDLTYVFTLVDTIVVITIIPHTGGAGIAMVGTVSTVNPP
ncbi:MAG: hypothetical protein ACRC3B_04380, partial [Bacteroidia bacterium]